MSAELLREAAAKMREDPDARWRAVGAWMKRLADVASNEADLGILDGRHATAAARAYLGRES
jgi:hypothetical protein